MGANLGYLLIILFCLIIIILQYLDLKKAKKNLSVITKTKQTLYLLSEKISKADNIQEVYDCILDTAINIIPYASKGSILMLDEDGFFRFRALKGHSCELKKISLKREELFLYKINNFREPAIVRNPSKFDEIAVDESTVNQFNSLEALEISCTLCCPIYIDNKFIGLLNVDSIKSRQSFKKDDLDLMNHIKNELQVALKTSIIKDKLSHMANFDELTGIYNRRYFNVFFRNELRKMEEKSNRACLAVIDMNDFKSINDNYGHLTGDKVLIGFTNVLKEVVKNKGVYARMSGDEFVILFKDCNSQQASEIVLELRGLLKNKPIESIKVNFSYGLCEINNYRKKTTDEIFSEADKAMYKEKANKYKM